MSKNNVRASGDMGVRDEHTCLFPIVFAANDGYVPYAGVAIESVILNANPCNLYRIHVLHTTISQKHTKDLEGMSTDNVTVRCINVESLIGGVHASLPTGSDVTVETYYRILIPEVEELRGYPYVIYLDCDVVLNTDLDGIVPQDMGTDLIAAVRDYPAMKKVGAKRLKRDLNLNAEQYVNAGILVINIPQWIREKTFAKCLEFLGSTSPKKLMYYDQDVLNCVCRDRISYLDVSWNYNWYLRYGDKETVERCKAIVDKVGDDFHILHFTTSSKPWRDLDHPYSRYFWKYAGRSPFLEEIIKANLCDKAKLESHSVPLRIARAATFLPRKMRGAVWSLRDNGAGYTFRRVLYYLGLWEDEWRPPGPDNRPRLIVRAERLLQTAKGKRGS